MLQFKNFLDNSLQILNFFLNLHHQIIETHGVIGNTPVFGTDIRGSSPCGSTNNYCKSVT